VLVAFETLHYMKTKRMGKTWFMTMKLDMSKAYDRGPRGVGLLGGGDEENGLLVMPKK
jgi:hypothetical protein